MAGRARQARETGAEIEFNMTPMIDVTFQLIIFFVIAGQIASEALTRRVELPHPDASQALKADDHDVANKIIVNVVSKADVNRRTDPYLAGKVECYMAGQMRIETHRVADLTRLIADQRRKLPTKLRKDFFVEIRADRRVHFRGVEPVLMAAVRAGVSKMNITARLDLGS